MLWHLITGAYPPQPGGVSDYTRLVATGLAAASDDVCVWAPQCPGGQIDDFGVTVRRLPSCFGPRSLAILDRELARRPGSILVQYVPHAFGMKAMNLPLCLWLYARRRRDIAVMFHEVNFPVRFGQSTRHNALGLVTCAMAAVVARAAARIFVSTCAWESRLRRYLPSGREIYWLPVPNNIPVTNDRVGLASARRRYASGDGLILGHFGVHRAETAQAMTRFLPGLVRGHQRLSVVLAGAGSIEFRERLLSECADLASRIHATGPLAPERLSPVLSACDVAVQPFPDGVSTRRTSAMALLAHGVPLVTNRGFATEPIWADSGAIALGPEDDYAAMGPLAGQLLKQPAARADFSNKAKDLYARRFDLKHTIAALRSI